MGRHRSRAAESENARRSCHAGPICGGWCDTTISPETTALRQFSNEKTVPQPCLRGPDCRSFWEHNAVCRVAAGFGLPCADRNLRPRFVRTCDVFELSEVERRIFAALLMMRSTHAFTTVKLNGSVGYGGGSSIYGAGSKPGVTLAAIIDVTGDFADRPRPFTAWT